MTPDEAVALLRREDRDSSSSPGCVYLVGTGPGDPGLLTLKAYRLMQTADVVFYDRLISQSILELVHSEARMVYVGKQSSFHTRTQEEIHELMMIFAEAGSTVLRLKGGDPYIFGRGGEEMEYLSDHGIPVRCVPGVTAASGISAELGIPLTHRSLATSVRFLTGHSREGGEKELEDTMGRALDPRATLVVYMGLQTLPLTIHGMIQNGQDPATPAVAVERGTTEEQRSVYSELKGLVKAVQEAELKSPTLLVIGKVVSLSPGWKQYQSDGVHLQEGRMGDCLSQAWTLLTSKEGLNEIKS